MNKTAKIMASGILQNLVGTKILSFLQQLYMQLVRSPRRETIAHQTASAPYDRTSWKQSRLIIPASREMVEDKRARKWERV